MEFGWLAGWQLHWLWNLLWEIGEISIFQWLIITGRLFTNNSVNHAIPMVNMRCPFSQTTTTTTTTNALVCFLVFFYYCCTNSIRCHWNAVQFNWRIPKSNFLVGIFAGRIRGIFLVFSCFVFLLFFSLASNSQFIQLFLISKNAMHPVLLWMNRKFVIIYCEMHRIIISEWRCAWCQSNKFKYFIN